MATSQLGTNSPNGTVGVHGWLRNGDLQRYSPGVIQGFTPSFSGMSVLPANGSTYNVCQAYNANGDMEIIGLNAADTTALALHAPTTSGQSICYAIVVSRAVNTTTTVNDGIGSVMISAIAGAAATTGSQTIPTESTIRAAITNGSTAYICVVMTVTVPYGTTALASSMVNATLPGTVSVNGDSDSGSGKRLLRSLPGTGVPLMITGTLTGSNGGSGAHGDEVSDGLTTVAIEGTDFSWDGTSIVTCNRSGFCIFQYRFVFNNSSSTRRFIRIRTTALGTDNTTNFIQSSTSTEVSLECCYTGLVSAGNTFQFYWFGGTGSSRLVSSVSAVMFGA